MPVGEPIGYIENEAHVPDLTHTGSVPTDGTKGAWDSSLRYVSRLWDHLPWSHSHNAEPEPTVASEAPEGPPEAVGAPEALPVPWARLERLLAKVGNEDDDEPFGHPVDPVDALLHPPTPPNPSGI